MIEVAEYLMTNYYPYYTGNRTDVVPDRETLLNGLKNHKDKIVIIRDDKIKGVAVYANMSDDTYEFLDMIDITRFDIIVKLLQEHGPNVHVLMLAADGYTTMMEMKKEITQKVNPRTISWWNKDLSKLHRYIIRR